MIRVKFNRGYETFPSGSFHQGYLTLYVNLIGDFDADKIYMADELYNRKIGKTMQEIFVEDRKMFWPTPETSEIPWWGFIDLSLYYSIVQEFREDVRRLRPLEDINFRIKDSKRGEYILFDVEDDGDVYEVCLVVCHKTGRAILFDKNMKPMEWPWVSAGHDGDNSLSAHDWLMRWRGQINRNYGEGVFCPI